MPLLVLGLIVLVGILAIEIVKYLKIKRYDNHSGRTKQKNNEPENEQEKTLYFPTENIETEKHKRSIH